MALAWINSGFVSFFDLQTISLLFGQYEPLFFLFLPLFGLRLDHLIEDQVSKLPTVHLGIQLLFSQLLLFLLKNQLSFLSLPIFPFQLHVFLLMSLDCFNVEWLIPGLILLEQFESLHLLSLLSLLVVFLFFLEERFLQTVLFQERLEVEFFSFIGLFDLLFGLLLINKLLY